MGITAAGAMRRCVQWVAASISLPELDELLADGIGERMEKLTVRDIMHRQLFVTPPDQPLRKGCSE